VPSAILEKWDANAAIVISLAGLANGSSRASAALTNTNNRPKVRVFLRIQSNASGPTAGAPYDVFWLWQSPTAPIRSDGWGGTDAAITILNSVPIGGISVTTSANTNFTGVFDIISPGPTWGIAVRNSSGQALNATEGNHIKESQYAYYESQ